MYRVALLALGRNTSQRLGPIPARARPKGYCPYPARPGNLQAVNVKKGTLGADALLLVAAIIWGFAFSAQRMGMEHIGPLAYNCVRYAVGALFLLPFVAYRRARARASVPKAELSRLRGGRKAAAMAAAGGILFAGSVLQQAGIVTTTAGNAGFITSLYVVLVPLIGFLFGKPSNLMIWAGALVAVVGLYILSMGSGFSMSSGDLLVLAGSLFWSFHILIVSRLVMLLDPIELAVGQFAVCSALSLVGALALESAPFAGVLPAAIPILYGGIPSCGIAFTLQIVAQKTAHPAHASIILSMEALFAGIGGILLLGEPLTARLALGGMLMLAGAVVSQLELPRAQRL
jgi:drug/metabolite transporter (DMT)-like permease